MNNYPTASKYNIEESIIPMTDYIRNIITSSLKLRNENNIKVRQPLSKLYLLNTTDIKEYETIILSELNIKEIIYLTDFNSLKNEFLTLNFRNAGAYLKEDVNKVKEILTNINNHNSYVTAVKNNQSIEIPGYEMDLIPSIFNIESKAKENISLMEDGSLKIGVDLSINEELKKEGYLREIIRNCQVFRKEVGFNVDDRIKIFFITENEYINNLLSEYKNTIENELLAVIEENNGITKEIIDDDIKINVILEKK